MDNPLEDLELVEDFVQEATERIDSAADHALDAENGDPVAGQALRRELHSLKGAAGFLGLDAFSELCHELEDFLIRVPPECVGDGFDVVHGALDLLRAMVLGVERAASERRAVTEEPGTEVILEKLRTC